MKANAQYLPSYNCVN